MRYSFKVWPQQVEWPALVGIWQQADRDGFWDMAWFNDHLYPPKSDPGLPIMDAWSLLAAMAASTERLRMGTMVSANTFRHPVLLAKTATTIDRISEGRLEIGIGTGWHEGEHRAFDIPLPPVSERFDRLEETFTILDGLMTRDVFSHEGRFHTIREARFEPKPVQRPRPPFVVGGGGMLRTVPLAARWADHYNYPDYEDDLGAFAQRVARLRELEAEFGRPSGSIEISAQFRYPGDLSETVDRVAGYAETGADHVLVSFTPPTEPSLPAKVAEALAG